MPQPPLDEPVTKVTLNLWASDVAWAKAQWGAGWSGEIRNLLRKAKLASKKETVNVRP